MLSNASQFVNIELIFWIHKITLIGEKQTKTHKKASDSLFLVFNSTVSQMSDVAHRTLVFECYTRNGVLHLRADNSM